MNYVEHPKRERTLGQALRARTFSEIASATHEMDQWLEDHPDDFGILDAYEVLANMQEIAEFQQRQEFSRRPKASCALPSAAPPLGTAQVVEVWVDRVETG